MTEPGSGGNRAIVLMSGGLDSCVTAAIARQDRSLFAMHASYGQRTEARELAAFRQQASFYRAEEQMVIDMGYLGRMGGSSLTDTGIAVPPSNLDSQDIPNTYVPFRNAHMLAAAVSWAEVIDAGEIFIGAVEEDSSGYPDCRPEYYEAMNRLIETGTRPETVIRVRTPLIHMRKPDIIRKGMELGAPLNLTWSCYRAEDRACGACDSCALRLRAFRDAGLSDPIQYDDTPQYANIGREGGAR